MKNIVCCLTVLLFSLYSSAQSLLNPNSIQPEAEFENILTKEIFSDQHSTTNIIWIKNEVKLHYHASHTEQIYVLEGEALMILGDEMIQLVPEVLVTIPEGTRHSVQVTSEIPLKVISVQSPQFDGTDRVIVDE